MAFASDETLERHQVKVHGAEPSEKLKKMMEEEKKAEDDELDVMDMDDGGMDFGSDSEDEVVPLPVINKPSIGAGKMAAIKANMAKAAITGKKIRLKSHRGKKCCLDSYISYVVDARLHSSMKLYPRQSSTL